MPWPSRRARLNEVQWQRTNGALSTVLELRRELTTKQQYASRLEFLLHQRSERIDQLQGQVEQLRLKNNQSHEEAEHMAMFVGLILDLSERSEESFGTVAAKQSTALRAEYQQLLDENDALRAEIVKLKWKLENCEMIRKDQASYIRGLWEDNQRVHTELRYFNRQEERGLRPAQRGEKPA